MRQKFLVKHWCLPGKYPLIVWLFIFVVALCTLSPINVYCKGVVPDLKNRIMGSEVIKELGAVNLEYTLYGKDVVVSDARGRIISQSIHPGYAVRPGQNLKLGVGIYKGRDLAERRVLEIINQGVLADISKNELTLKYLDRVVYSGPVNIELKKIPVPPDGQSFHWQASVRADFYLLKDYMRYGYVLFEFESRPLFDKKSAYDDAVRELSEKARMALLSFFHSKRSGDIAPLDDVPVLTVNIQEINDQMDKQIDNMIDALQKSFQVLN